MKKIWSWIILTIVFVLVIIFLIQHKDFLGILKGIKLSYLVILLFLASLTTALNGLQIKYIIQVYGKNLKFKDWYGLSVVTTMTNYITPFRGGAPVKAVYLKRVHGMSYTVCATTIGAIIILSMFIYSLLGVIISVIHNLGFVIGVVFFVVFLIMGFTIFLLPSLPLTRNEKVNHLIKSVNYLKDLRKNYKSIIVLLLINLFILTVTTFRMYYSFRSISYSLPLSFCFVISLFTELSLVISIIPGNLGVKESIITFLAKTFGLSSKVGLSAAIVDRAVAVTLVFTLGPLFSYILSRQKKPSEDKWIK